MLGGRGVVLPLRKQVTDDLIRSPIGGRGPDQYLQHIPPMSQMQPKSMVKHFDVLRVLVHERGEQRFSLLGLPIQRIGLAELNSHEPAQLPIEWGTALMECFFEQRFCRAPISDRRFAQPEQG